MLTVFKVITAITIPVGAVFGAVVAIIDDDYVSFFAKIFGVIISAVHSAFFLWACGCLPLYFYSVARMIYEMIVYT